MNINDRPQCSGQNSDDDVKAELKAFFAAAACAGAEQNAFGRHAAAAMQRLAKTCYGHPRRIDDRRMAKGQNRDVVAADNYSSMPKSTTHTFTEAELADAAEHVRDILTQSEKNRPPWLDEIAGEVV